MNCRKCHQKMIPYVEGSLKGEELTSVEAHLAECPRCLGFARYLQKALALAGREMDMEPSPWFYTRVKARLQKEGESGNVKIRERILQPAFFSLLLLLAVFSGIQLGKITTPRMTEYETAAQYIPWMNEIDGEPMETFLMK